MQRYYNLDFLRAFAMMLGWVIHAPIIFYFPGLAKTLGIEKIAPTENWVFVMITFISNWRMPLFFILSGFFTNLVIEKKGTKTFIKDRVIRIGITCILFSLLYDILDDNLDFTTGHLWFLYELIILVFCFSILSKIQNIKDILYSEISLKNLSILIIYLTLTAPLAVIINNSFDHLALSPSETFFDLRPGNLVYYFSYFLFGVILYSNQNIFNGLAKNRIIILLGFLSIIAFFLHLYFSYLVFGEIEDNNNLEQLKFDPAMVLIVFLMRGINTICWCFFLIGLATKYFVSKSVVLSWFVELSYPLYLIHFLPVLIISVEFYNYGVSQVNIFFLTIIISFIISVIGYYIFIKYTPLNWIINGYHKSFLKIN